MKPIIETFWDPLCVYKGKLGSWRARLQEDPEMISAGSSEDDAVSHLLQILAGKGMSGNADDYDIIPRPNWKWNEGDRLFK